MIEDQIPFVQRDIDSSKLINTTTFPVEHGVPMPMKAYTGAQALYNGHGRPPVYPWHLMKIGDSFFVPGATIKGMSAKASQAGARLCRRYECRTMDGGVRVWRTDAGLA
jgi:hypothetical protein